MASSNAIVIASVAGSVGSSVAAATWLTRRCVPTYCSHMRDHKVSTRGSAGRNVVGVRELKTHAARILRRVRESRTSYILTHRGRAVGLILPVEPTQEAASGSEDPAAAWDTFLRAGRQIERQFLPGVSGVRLLSEMRR